MSVIIIEHAQNGYEEPETRRIPPVRALVAT
jgi:hypothetical protein